jgi:hypothetical protein
MGPEMVLYARCLELKEEHIRSVFAESEKNLMFLCPYIASTIINDDQQDATISFVYF